MIQDLLFPKFCVGCGFLGVYICLSCEKKLQPVLRDLCLYCEKPSYLGKTHESCKQPHGIDGVLSMYLYNKILQDIIKNIKYKAIREVFKELFQIITNEHVVKFYRFRRIYNTAMIQPIPLHKNRLKQRGFNQSEILTRFFIWCLGYKRADLIIRNKETHAQAQTQNRNERYINVKEAFMLQNDFVPPKAPVVLVDDVVTTGNTVKEAARVLKKAGVSQVFVFSLGRG